VVPVKVQTSFTVKLLKFEDGKKVALIKEIKSLLEGMNLVQVKGFLLEIYVQAVKYFICVYYAI
jgi:ribosomal protein L7/L12